ncbi:MAG TPA: sigma-70 family RNA polymerase sigma factor [Polyangiaceae bacterium]|nr:sigma-70 family RNA polymerase sigma factor [Polyangiaceae bacterium]
MSPKLASTAQLPPAVDAARLEVLFAQHFTFIWRLLRRLGLDAETADDAAQQAFLIAAERLSDIRPGCERSFLYGTALRLFRDLRRAELRTVRDSGHDLVSEQPNVEERIDEQRALQWLDAALAGLEQDLREVFVLFELERLPTPQIAELLGIPVGTAASRLRRARVEFRVLVARLSKPRAGGTS